MRSRVYETVKRTFVCPSHRSTTAAECGGFAAEDSIDSRRRRWAATAPQHATQQHVGSVMLTAELTRLNTDLSSAYVHSELPNPTNVGKTHLTSVYKTSVSSWQCPHLLLSAVLRRRCRWALSLAIGRYIFILFISLFYLFIITDKGGPEGH